MIKYYPYILGIKETLDEWNEKLREMTTGKNALNVGTGTIVLGVLILVAVWAIRNFNKQ